jgi:DNA invertase Pin-like site-specific DNA recombinase
MKQVALYARVSTLDKGQNPEMQLSELRTFANARGWNIVKEYVDHGISGAKEQRPALDELWRDAKARRFDIVAVWKLDRFGRSTKHLINSLSEFDALGVAFVSLRDGFDLTTPGGRAMFGMVAVMSNFERDLIRERVSAGIAYARAQGRTWKRGLSKKKKLSRTTLWRRARAAAASQG